MATKAVNTAGVKLAVKVGSDWKFFSEVKAVPEIGVSPALMDATSLDSEVKESIEDIPDFSAQLDFTLNAQPATVTGSNLDLVTSLSEGAVYDWRIMYPRLNKEVGLKATMSWKMGAAAVSSVQEFILSLIPRGKPQWSDVSATWTVTYNSNGGTGTMTDSNVYQNGASVTTKTCTFTYEDKLFSNWNTASDGTGVAYDEADVFTIYRNTTLYAIWRDA